MKKTLTNQYLFLVRGAACDREGRSPEEMQAQMRDVYAWIDGLTRKGVMTAAQPLIPGGRMISGKAGNIISDGIAAESKEAIGGYFIVNASSMDEAEGIARTSPAFKYGETLEVRQIANLDSD